MTDEEKDNMGVRVFIEEMKFRLPDFALTMQRRLAEKREQGKGGWEDPERCSIPYLSMLLRRAVEKGNPIDVANFSMMIWMRNAKITQGVHDEYTVAAAERLAAVADGPVPQNDDQAYLLAVAAKNPIPTGILYDEGTECFYVTETDQRVLGADFHSDWFSRRFEFPRRAADADNATR